MKGKQRKERKQQGHHQEDKEGKRGVKGGKDGGEGEDRGVGPKPQRSLVPDFTSEFGGFVVASIDL
eukprot:14317028-Ditylum_brightwellii.AAC.1